MLKMQICYILIFVLVLINIAASLYYLQGNWRTTDDFFEASGTEIFLNISGYAQKNCRFILSQNDETVILDGNIYFINYNPLTALGIGCSGLAVFSGFEETFPKYVKFFYKPGYLKFWKDVVYGEFNCFT